MSIIESSAVVAVGIDAAVVANHHVVVRRTEAGRPGTMVDDFVVPPTLAGMERLTKRRRPRAGTFTLEEWHGMNGTAAVAGTGSGVSAGAESAPGPGDGDTATDSAPILPALPGAVLADGPWWPTPALLRVGVWEGSGG